jgi:HEAT repeat protein
LQQLSTAKTVGEKVVVLTALGAAGTPSSLAATRPFVSDSNEQIRGAAAQSLRRIAGGEADQLLSTLAADSTESVKMKALDAISERAPNPLLAEVVSNVALTDESVLARAAAVRIAGEWLRSMPQLRTTLARVVDMPGQDINVVRIAQSALKGIASRNP